MNKKERYFPGFIKIVFVSLLFLTGILYLGNKISKEKPLIITDVNVQDNQVNEDKNKLKKVKKIRKKNKKTRKKEVQKEIKSKIKEKTKESVRAISPLIVKGSKKNGTKISLRIEKLKIIQLPEDKVIRITLRLRNRTKDVRVRGRFFVKFLKGSKSFVYPESRLIDGLPVEVSKGIFYNIKRFKREEIIIDKGIDLKSFDTVQFFIFENTETPDLVYSKKHRLNVESGDIFKNPY